MLSPLPSVAVLDSNWVIGIAKGDVAAPTYAVVSAISRAEVLGFPNISTEEESILHQVLSQVNLVSIDDQVIDTAIQIRRKVGGKTVDVLIAATVLVLELPLLTRDRDFLCFQGQIQVIGI